MCVMGPISRQGQGDLGQGPTEGGQSSLSVGYMVSALIR